jgi:hypothetical protein
VNKIYVWLSGVVALLAVLIFFWPTPYYYDDGGLTRVNRFTGKVQKAETEGWVDADSGPPAETDMVTPEVAKAFEQVSATAQDFDSITLTNPGPWTFTLIEKAQVDIEGCGAGGTDYVLFLTADRTLDAGNDRVVHLPYPDRFRKALVEGCGGGSHKRTITLIVNSAGGPDGSRWEAGSRLVTRKFEADVNVPSS